MKRLSPFIAVALVSVFLGAGSVVGVTYVRGTSSHMSNDVVNATAATATIRQISEHTSTSASPGIATSDFSALYAAIRPTIVEIDITGQSGRRRSRQIQAQGSGVVLDTNGTILTNDHVVSGAQTITVTFTDGATASADIVSTDPTDDLAIIRTNANKSELHPATLGDSSALKVGNVVVAVGNPFGLAGSFTTGVISGLDRTLHGVGGQADQEGLLQTDAAINQGSSGGGLFDTQGELIGITSDLENPDASTFAGVGYAVPINIAKQAMRQFLGG